MNYVKELGEESKTTLRAGKGTFASPPVFRYVLLFCAANAVQVTNSGKAPASLFLGSGPPQEAQILL